MQIGTIFIILLMAACTSSKKSEGSHLKNSVPGGYFKINQEKKIGLYIPADWYFVTNKRVLKTWTADIGFVYRISNEDYVRGGLRLYDDPAILREESYNFKDVYQGQLEELNKLQEQISNFGTMNIAGVFLEQIIETNYFTTEMSNKQVNWFYIKEKWIEGKYTNKIYSKKEFIGYLFDTIINKKVSNDRNNIELFLSFSELKPVPNLSNTMMEILKSVRYMDDLTNK